MSYSAASDDAALGVRASFLGVCATLLGACASAPPPVEEPPQQAQRDVVEQTSEPLVPAEAEPSSTAPLPAPVGCGDFTCRRFRSASEALLYVLAEDQPSALGVGESHALESTQHIASATHRFTSDLLPAIADRTSDLIVELLAPPEQCDPDATERVQREEEQITQGQASTNQNEFVTLGHRARELGVVPDILRASCADLTAIAEAGDEGVLVMMETIARLTTQETSRLLARQSASNRKLVVAYGGALHNDLTPRPGRETWSYGPKLAELTGGRYTAVDLIVPEHIQATAGWKALPWYDAVPELTDDSAVLMRLAPRDWVIFFPTDVPAENLPSTKTPHSDQAT